MAWIEAPETKGKPTGNSYSPPPTATAPVLDSTCWDAAVFCPSVEALLVVDEDVLIGTDAQMLSGHAHGGS